MAYPLHRRRPAERPLVLLRLRPERDHLEIAHGVMMARTFPRAQGMTWGLAARPWPVRWPARPGRPGPGGGPARRSGCRRPPAGRRRSWSSAARRRPAAARRRRRAVRGAAPSTSGARLAPPGSMTPNRYRWPNAAALTRSSRSSAISAADWPTVSPVAWHSAAVAAAWLYRRSSSSATALVLAAAGGGAMPSAASAAAANAQPTATALRPSARSAKRSPRAASCRAAAIPRRGACAR